MTAPRLTWHRSRRAVDWAPHYESADGRWKIEPIAYTVPCDGYIDGHNGCLGNTEHTREEWQLSELVDGRWIADEELYLRLRDAKQVAEGVAARAAITPAVEVEQLLDEVEARADAEHAADEEQRALDAVEPAPLVERVAAVLDATIVPIASVRPHGEGRALVTIGDRVIGDPQRYADTGSIAGRHYSARSALARAGYRENPAGGTQIIVEDREPVGVDEPGPEIDNPREQPRPVEWSEIPGPEVATRSAGSRLSNAAVLSMLRNGGPWAEQDPRVVGPDRA